MAITTRATLRQMLAQDLNWWRQLTATSAGGALNKIISTGLNQYDRGQDDAFNNQWVWETVNASQRLVSDYVTSGGTLTVYAAFAGTITSGGTFELHPYEPALLHDCLNDARDKVYPYIHKRIVDETLVTNNCLPNSHFEDWTSSALDHWTEAGGSTHAEETTIIRGPKGTSSLKITGGTTTGATCDQGNWIALLDVENATLSFYCWAWCATADKARIQVYTKDSAGTAATSSSDYHTGGSEWELLKCENVVIPDDLAIIQVRLVNTATTAYFDNGYAFARPLFKYHLPSQFTRGPVQVFVQNTGSTSQSAGNADVIDGISSWLQVFDWDTVDDGVDKYLTFKNTYPTRFKMKLIGMEPLSSVSTDAGTMEVNSRQATAVVAAAAADLFKRLASSPTSDDVGRYKDLQAMWSNEASQRTMEQQMKMPNAIVKGDW